MFRDQAQSTRAIKVLLGLIDKADLWSDAGPTEELWLHYDSDGSRLSSGERVIVLASMVFWSSGRNKLSLADAYHKLDSTLAEALFGLLTAATKGFDSSGAPVDEWIARWSTS